MKTSTRRQLRLSSLFVVIAITGVVCAMFLPRSEGAYEIHGAILGGTLTLPPTEEELAQPTNAPTKQEIWLYMSEKGNQSFSLPDDFAFVDAKLSFVEHREDEAKMVPLLGPSKLHHNIYRCTVTGTSGGQTTEKQFFVDHNYYELVVSSALP